MTLEQVKEKLDIKEEITCINEMPKYFKQYRKSDYDGERLWYKLARSGGEFAIGPESDLKIDI